MGSTSSLTPNFFRSFSADGIVFLAEEPVQLRPHLLDVLGIDAKKALDALLESGLELAHPRHEIEVEVRRQKPEPFVRPGQRDLVEVLPDLAGERAQLIQFVGAAQKLLVVAARALVRPMLIRDIAADLAVVFDGRPDADVDGGEHCSFRNH